MIESLSGPRRAKVWCDNARARGLRIGYVPTMGALHRGHLSLVERAARENDLACASIFVNPLQFERADDLQKYPRDEARDHALLEQAGCAMVYGGALAQFFPRDDAAAAAARDAGKFARGLEGKFRRGHLQGVRAIVEKLFATVGACTAYFGEKDFQQCLLVQEIAAEFDGIDVTVCACVREESGLAMSSRNRRLSDAQLRAAPKIYQALCAAQSAWRDGERDSAALEKIMRAQMQDALIQIEYAEVRDAANWSEHAPPDLRNAGQPRALIAAYLGAVRLIDNAALG